MATIYIDDVPYEVESGQSLLSACLALGFNIPYFCWHPALHSVGACRQCAVKQFRNEKDTRGFITMSCMTEAANGTRISIDDLEAKEFRKSVIELLMMNHPHDCPVCDEGGECHLQDMTVMTGHNYRDYSFPKRTYQNQDLGPFINHEMNRCIQCYRCVRFYKDYAGGKDFSVFGVHSRIYFGRFADGTLESEFSGNLVEVCPTGVFTDKTLRRHYTRKWDLQTAPSICVHCGVGCNTIPGERYGELRRIHNRYNGQVNRYFLCDRGRYGYEFVNSDQRLRQPMFRASRRQPIEPTGKEDALQYLASMWPGSGGVIGIGSPRASLEANFVLRSLVGSEGFYLGIPGKEYALLKLALEILSSGPARSASLHDAELADAVLVLGEDISNVAPMMALALRQSVRQKPMEICDKIGLNRWADAAVRETVRDRKGPLFISTTAGTRLDDVATRTFHGAPDDIARLGFAVARELSDDAPEVTDLPDEVRSLAREIAEALQEAKRPLVVSGTSCGSESVLQAAANVAWALCKDNRSADLSFVVPEANSLGLAMIGGRSLDAAFGDIADKKAEMAIILENDLYRRAGSEELGNFFEGVKTIVAIDHLQNRTAAKADFILPAAAFAEAGGTLINNEGRGQRFFPVMSPHENVQDSWRWLRDIMRSVNRSEAEEWQSIDDIVAAMAKAVPAFKAVPEIAPPAGFRIEGMKVPRQPHRYSGRTAMLANLTVHEPKPPDDSDSPLSFSMEGYEGRPPAPLIPRFWSPGWNSAQAVNKFQEEIAGPLRGGDPGHRLIEPPRDGTVQYFREPPEAFCPRVGEWLIVPAYHIFGSEELSVLSPGIAERSPQPYIGLSPADAQGLQLTDGLTVRLTIAEIQLILPVRLVSTLPSGVAALPVGLPGVEAVDLPGWGMVSVERNG
ncbi:MAG: NADH-quinone oxidoreductase subunit NuoG [Desulfomonile tiedjei]|nr:NADH-quinone oxidoreductase subunit NuoG [Desulfomonile tiedjei]